MTGFHHEISSRIAAVQENLAHAVAHDDPFLVDVHVGELESLARMAADHGVTVAGVTETLARHGVLGGGGAGIIAPTGPIDLRLAERAASGPAAGH